MMTLPTKLRTYYDKIVAPASDLSTSGGSGATGAGTSGSGGGSRMQKLSGNTVQHMVGAYSKMNKFLTRFLEHVSFIIYIRVQNKNPM